MKIKLTQSKFALIDDEDYKKISNFKWHFLNGYAIHTTSRKLGKQKAIFMHRLINNTPKDLLTDHINRNKLDNRKKNLRNADRQLNTLNRDIYLNNTSGIKGVSWVKRDKKWMAKYGTKTLGVFRDINQAISIRKIAERKALQFI